MTMITQEEFDFLNTYQNTLRQAKSGYYSCFEMQSALKMNDIYFRLTGSRENVSCGRCLLNVLKYLAAEYDQFLESQKKAVSEPVVEMTADSSKYTTEEKKPQKKAVSVRNKNKK